MAGRCGRTQNPAKGIQGYGRLVRTEQNHGEVRTGPRRRKRALVKGAVQCGKRRAKPWPLPPFSEKPDGAIEAGRFGAAPQFLARPRGGADVGLVASPERRVVLDGKAKERLRNGKERSDYIAVQGRRFRIADKAVARFKDRVRELTRRHRGVSLEKMIADLNPFVRGWAGYFGFSQWRELPSLDGWIRRRLLASSGSSGRRAVSATASFVDSRSPKGRPVRLSSAQRDRGG
jgi:hypothetical protein